MENLFVKLFQNSEKRPAFIAADTCLRIAIDIEAMMKKKNINNTQLAKLLDCSKPYITKVLKGDANLTINTLAKLSIALDCELTTRLEARGTAKQVKQLAEIFEEMSQLKSQVSLINSQWNSLMGATKQRAEATDSTSLKAVSNNSKFTRYSRKKASSVLMLGQLCA
jgi:transcriptional regulator with XRE-family HTH domain